MGRSRVLGGPWSQAEVLDSEDEGQLPKDHAGSSVVAGLEGERKVKEVLGITQVRDGEGQVPTLLPP